MGLQMAGYMIQNWVKSKEPMLIFVQLQTQKDFLADF